MAQGKIKKSDVSVKDPFGNVSQSATEAEAKVKSLEVTLKLVKEMAKEVKSSLAGNKTNNTKGIKDQNELLIRSNEIAKAKLKVDKRLKEEKIKLQELTRRENKEIRESVKNNLKLGDSTERLQRKVNKAQREFKNLAIEQGINSRAARRAKKRFDELDGRLRSVNDAARDGRRDVGRYGLALKKVGGFIKGGLGFIGLTAGIYGVFRAIGDTFGRIRDFDKEMNNMAAIAGKTRKELASTEKEIINVAGASIKTSNEVAQLATTLFALGKTEAEIKKLLKPVNDLSIALGATSEESGELLVSTLNAFGKSSDSAGEYADIISNIRSSTSLDFQRIKEALGFVAPTASALNLSLGKTGALVGVLQDNGVKAARAGRLLNTSFIRLLDKGLTLDKALEKINKSQNKLAESSKLFGAESATIGLILAENTDKVDELTNKFDNLSEGSLKKLTDEQLKSLDAQFKILDSSWEKFILGVENGEGVFGKFIRDAVAGLNTIIATFEDLSRSYKDIVLEVQENSLTENTKRDIEEFGNFLKVTNQVGQSQKELRKTALRFLDVDIKRVNQIRKSVKSLDDLSKADRQQFIILSGRITAILNSVKAQKESNDAQEKANVLAGKGAKKVRELTGLIEKQAEVVSKLSEEINRSTNEGDILKLSLELDVEEEELERLKRIVSSTIEEITKIELDLIEDQTEKRIAKEIDKSEKLIKQIETNSRVEESVKKRLISDENKRLDRFIIDEELKRNVERTKIEADFAKAEFEKRRTGFKTEEAFEKERAEQFKAIKRNQLQAELDLLEFYAREEDGLRIEQLKAQIEGLNSFEQDVNKFNHDAIEKALEFTEALYEEHYDKRLELIQREAQAHKDNLSEFKKAARDGNIAAKESLAEENRLAEQAKAEENRIEKEKQSILMVTAVLKAFNSELASGKNTGQALISAITNTTALQQFAKALPAFIDGTEHVGTSLGAPQLRGKDGYIIRVDGDERIVDPENNHKIGNYSNDQVADIMEQYRLGNLTSNSTLAPVFVNDYSKMESELALIKKAIIDKPESTTDFGQITQGVGQIIQTKRTGNRVTVNRFIVK